ncbi:MAG: SDR family oxidoreductase [Dehalococcoidia bacterium]|nr:SDR family oxidoreductase [Dehalococcoidia bacterium]
MAGSLESKVALVTGGGSGMGRATALIFAREGARVVVADVNAEGGEDTVSMINDAGGEAIFAYADVSRAADVEAMVNRAVETYGRLDCAHNNAGIEGPVGLRTHEYPDDAWGQLMSVNLKGVWLCLRYEIPQMLKQGGGAIVNTSSAAGLVGMRGASAYAATKHGVAGLTKTAALEYARPGIGVDAVCPGFIHTPMFARINVDNPRGEEQASAMEPVGRLGTPEEVAEVVVWLCSDAASFVTGNVMPVDAGFVIG